jgi:TonB-linked SusC/RagA family outer membrane protein
MNKNILYKNVICLCLVCFISSFSMSFSQTQETLVDLGIGIPQTKENSTASVYTISGKDLQKTSAITLQDALYGKLLGLTALKSGGFSGDGGYGGYFNIRGNKTSTENNLLILVDGLERPIDRLSVYEVESVTVLKDAAALALYGFRGVNGAISVKTVHSTQNKLAVSVNYDHKIQFNPPSTQFVDASTYASALNEARSMDGLTPAYNQYELDAFTNNTYPKIYPNVDWKSAAMKNTALENQATIKITGGNDDLKYLTMVNFVNGDGLLNGTETNAGFSTQLKYSKANIRTNLDVDLTKTTKFHINIMGNFVETNRPTGVNSWDIMSFLNNTPASAYPIVMANNRTWGGTAAYGASNIVARIQGTGATKTHERSIFADAELVQNLDQWVKGLSTSIRVGYDNRSQITEQKIRPFEYGNTRYNFNGTGVVTDSIKFIAGSKTDLYTFSDWLSSAWTSSNLQLNLDYARQFGKHNVSSSLMYTTNGTVSMGQYNKFNRANVSLSGHYDYANKYIADFALIESGSNRSWPQKYAFSPTLSLGWVLTNENFLKDVKGINLIKLRASAGILHSDYVPSGGNLAPGGLSLESYGASAGWFTFGSGYGENWGNFLSYFPTKSFALETSKKVNVGLDMRFLNSLELTVDGYYERRDNILQSAGVLNSLVVGIPSSYINKGIVDSKGIEVGINYQKSIGDFVINSGALFTYGTNTIVDMVEPTLAFPYLSQIGHPVGQSFGLEAIGFFKDQADIAGSPFQAFDRVMPGDVKYKDVNGDGVINDNDRVAMGYAGYPEINYSFNLGLEYKGLGFNVLFQGVGNYTQQLGVTGVFQPLVINSNLSSYYLANCWRPNQDNTNAIYPRLTSLYNANSFRSSTLWYADASFIKLRNCEVYYKLPKSVLDKLKIEAVKLYVKGENLLSIDKLPANTDPENIWGGYPILPAVSFGASIMF